MKNKKTAFTAVFLYVLITFGIWFFLTAYSNSYNKLSVYKIQAASLTFETNSAYISVLDNTYMINTAVFNDSSNIYYAGYLSAPDELRALSLIMSLLKNNA